MTNLVWPTDRFTISDILSDNNARSAAFGANSVLRTPFLSSVKTGTTDQVKDNWTVGYTRNVAVGVWVGNSDGNRMINTSGVTGAAPIWNQVLTTIYSNQAWLDEFKFRASFNPIKSTRQRAYHGRISAMYVRCKIPQRPARTSQRVDVRRTGRRAGRRWWADLPPPAAIAT